MHLRINNFVCLLSLIRRHILSKISWGFPPIKQRLLQVSHVTPCKLMYKVKKYYSGQRKWLMRMENVPVRDLLTLEGTRQWSSKCSSAVPRKAIFFFFNIFRTVLASFEDSCSICLVWWPCSPTLGNRAGGVWWFVGVSGFSYHWRNWRTVKSYWRALISVAARLTGV